MVQKRKKKKRFGLGVGGRGVKKKEIGIFSRRGERDAPEVPGHKNNSGPSHIYYSVCSGGKCAVCRYLPRCATLYYVVLC